jgi:serine/threonine protein kinase
MRFTMSERYKLKSLFAHGGMAEVYLGVALGAEGFEKPVAIKRILPRLAADARVAKMFTAEAKIASYLHHQNIVQTLDVGQGPDGLYIVMELVNGWDLGVLIDSASKAGRCFPAPLTAYIATQVIAGLSHAYRKTFQGKRLIAAHRDMSPSNVLISSEGEVKVADFGIARVEGFGGGGTEPGTFKGKVAYASPEMLRGEPATALCDQFALGIVLHELLTCAHPFGDADDLVGYIEKIQNETPLPMPGIPEELAGIVRKMLSRNPQGRYETLDLVSKALGQYLARSQSAANAAELMEFLNELQPPPPLAEGGERMGMQGGDTIVKASFSLHGAAPATPSLAQVNSWMAEAYDPDWKPTGPVMDASGKVERDTPLRAAPVRRAPAPVVEEKLELMERPAKESTAATQFDAEAPMAGIDVVRAAARIQPRGGIGKWAVLLLLVVAVVGAGAVLYVPRFNQQAQDNLPKALAAKVPQIRTRVLNIQSEPSGASVSVNGSQVGVTPFIAENLYPATELEVTVTMRGYRTWKGKIRGGEDIELSANLQKK